MRQFPFGSFLSIKKARRSYGRTVQSGTLIILPPKSRAEHASCIAGRNSWLVSHPASFVYMCGVVQNLRAALLANGTLSRTGACLCTCKMSACHHSVAIHVIRWSCDNAKEKSHPRSLQFLSQSAVSMTFHCVIVLSLVDEQAFVQLLKRVSIADATVPAPVVSLA
jgi:hypothetical protein